jgi:hypothetical protein
VVIYQNTKAGDNIVEAIQAVNDKNILQYRQKKYLLPLQKRQCKINKQTLS